MDYSFNSLEEIKLKDEGCCVLKIPVFRLLQSIFWPVISKLTSIITSQAVQADIMEFKLDRIFLIGKPIQLSKYTYPFIENTLIQKLSESMNIGSDLIVPSEEYNKEVILGASLYGLNSSIFTERIARKTYLVSIEGYTPYFTEKAQQKIEELNDNHKIYNFESKNVIAKTEAVKLYHQSAYNPSEKMSICPKDSTILIARGTKISTEIETLGIKKKFFAEENCVVHASK